MPQHSTSGGATALRRGSRHCSSWNQIARAAPSLVAGCCCCWVESDCHRRPQAGSSNTAANVTVPVLLTANVDIVVTVNNPKQVVLPLQLRCR